ncbi:uncharacterized protein LY79DRAFT_545250 [Colletotrichum navitas]|uniref:Uncharacterized protein n=1 Tax=Colletotrichum navitas TaxID=681940 RepID=A0AAD8V8A6_9PEZI|nr:uncharacterized protein LY79DRAFT_545250 [Colletotrichum navitas]KAK1596073.1 hypothetical protein LY79DRAFT_545250 [Colletotrichum navitas]
MKLVLFTMSLLAAESLALRCYCIYNHTKHNTITGYACPHQVGIDRHGTFFCQWSRSEREWIQACEREESGANGDCVQ